MTVGGLWATALARAGIEGDPRRWGRLTILAGSVLATFGAVVAGAGGAATVLVVAATGVAVGTRAAAGRGDRRADATLPALLEHSARSVRAGLALVPALESAAEAVGGPHGRELRGVAERIAGGAPVGDALAPWAQAHPRAPVRLVAAALEVAVETGGPRARALDGLAATLRNQAALDAEVRALASQAQASAAVLVALPLVFAVVGSAADPRLARTLLTRPIGLACLAAALVLDLAGGWWMHRIVTRASS